MAEVVVRFFAKLREKCGDMVRVDADSIEDLLLKLDCFDLREENVKVALNGEILEENRKLEDGDCVDILPPFSGG